VTDEHKAKASGSILGLAAVACVACCIGPTLAVLGAIAALGLASTIFIGAAGLLIAAAATAAFAVVRRRRRDTSCATTPDEALVELSRRTP
jgi:hypothetical protein